jgi:hypothetical protein
MSKRSAHPVKERPFMMAIRRPLARGGVEISA